jgi:hypothetical protein
VTRVNTPGLHHRAFVDRTSVNPGMHLLELEVRGPLCSTLALRLVPSSLVILLRDVQVWYGELTVEGLFAWAHLP